MWFSSLCSADLPSSPPYSSPRSHVLCQFYWYTFLALQLLSCIPFSSSLGAHLLLPPYLPNPCWRDQRLSIYLVCKNSFHVLNPFFLSGLKLTQIHCQTTWLSLPWTISHALFHLLLLETHWSSLLLSNCSFAGLLKTNIDWFLSPVHTRCHRKGPGFFPPIAWFLSPIA